MIIEVVVLCEKDLRVEDFKGRILILERMVKIKFVIIIKVLKVDNGV